MKLSDLHKQIIKEDFLEEDYPSNFDMEKFKSLSSFNARVKYCETTLQRISSGSSRIVYKIDDEKVLKLAKNKKGIGQNKIEIDMGGSEWYANALASVFDSHPDAFWVEMELARPIKLSDFKKYLGLDLNTIKLYVDYFYYTTINPAQGRRIRYSKPKEYDKELSEKLWEDDFFRDVFSMIGDFNVPPGDLYKKSSYGIVKRNGIDTMVIIDYGLTDDVYNEYYS